jgi:hypothetical protein
MEKPLWRAGLPEGPVSERTAFWRWRHVYGFPIKAACRDVGRLKASVRLMGKDLSLLFKESVGHLYGIGQSSDIGALMLD